MRTVVIYILVLMVLIFMMLIFQVPSYVSGGLLFFLHVLSIAIFFLLKGRNHEIYKIMNFESLNNKRSRHSHKQKD